jgi:transposase
MSVVNPHAADIDVGAQFHVVAVGPECTPEPVRSFRSFTHDLHELARWLKELKVTTVVMESTGVYWLPVFEILESYGFDVLLVNAREAKSVPGRKSDVNDATWIAELLAHGLIRASFVPPQPIQELRDLTRTRKELTREIVRHTQRIHAVLEEANIKLASVITDILGYSGRRMLKAIVAGETDAGRLADLGSSRLAAPREALLAALDGRIRDHHRFLIGQHLKTIEQVETTIGEFDARIEAALAPFRDAVERLKDVPGISWTAAQIVIAEIGVDMSQFPSADHLISWAGLCPRLDESAGKRRSTRLRKGATWLKPVLVQSALAAGRKKNSSFKTRYHALKGRLGPKKAAVAVAANLLRVIYHMLKDGTCYKDLGERYRRPRNPARAATNLANRIRALGYQVDIRPAA